MESLNRIFDVFSEERRRFALYALDDADGPVDLGELARQIRRWEDDGVSTDEYDDVVLSLTHKHLPRAAEAEYVEFDRAANEIRITGDPPEFRIVLAVSEAIEHPEHDPGLDLDAMAREDFIARLTPAEGSTD